MPSPSPSRTVYRVLRWGALVAVGLMIGLILRKSPPPNVVYDPQATARVEQKFAAADQANAAGQPAQVQLDRTEVNSYLQQNLQTSNSPAPASIGVPVPDQPPSGDAKPGFSTSVSDDNAATIEQVQSAVK